MNHPSDPLPLLPAELLRRYSCAEPTDTRFRAIARLRQSLWREQHGYACGRYLDANGRTRRLGSRVSHRVGRAGVNLVDLTLIPLVQHEIAYREVGAVINVERLWTNLLASQALTFNLFGPFKQRPALATAVMRRLVPDLVAIEMKYSEAPAGIAAPGRPRYDTLSRSADVFRDPDAPALRHAPIEQFWREQLLVTAMLERGHYHDGRLIVIAPASNAECQAAIARYRAELVSDDPGETRFQAVILEDLTAAVGAAGADTIAALVTERYLDFEPVHRALADTFRPAAGTG
jgi:hypothetical protein